MYSYGTFFINDFESFDADRVRLGFYEILVLFDIWFVVCRGFGVENLVTLVVFGFLIFRESRV